MDDSANAIVLPSPGSGTFTWRTPFEYVSSGVVLDVLGSETLKKRVKPSYTERDPPATGLCRVRLDKQRGVRVDLPEDLVPDAMVRVGQEPRVNQPMLTSRSDTATPANRSVIALIPGLASISLFGVSCNRPRKRLESIDHPDQESKMC